jgi:hypothetical protein
MSLLPQIKKLVSAECCNFQEHGPSGIRNYCFDRRFTKNKFVCIFFQDTQERNCRWFKVAVLPLNEDLKESMEEMKNVGTEDRATHSGSGSIQGPESKSGNPPKVSVKRVSVAQYRGPGLLSRTRIYGMASEKPENGR